MRGKFIMVLMWSQCTHSSTDDRQCEVSKNTHHKTVCWQMCNKKWMVL